MLDGIVPGGILEKIQPKERRSRLESAKNTLSESHYLYLSELVSYIESGSLNAEQLHVIFLMAGLEKENLTEELKTEYSGLLDKYVNNSKKQGMWGGFNAMTGEQQKEVTPEILGFCEDLYLCLFDKWTNGAHIDMSQKK